MKPKISWEGYATIYLAICICLGLSLGYINYKFFEQPRLRAMISDLKQIHNDLEDIRLMHDIVYNRLTGKGIK